MAHAWILRSLNLDEYERIAFERDLVAVGWSEVGNLAPLPEQSKIRDAVRAAFPFVGRDSVESYTGQLYQFRTSMARGDLVVLLRRSSPSFAIGWIAGEYTFRDDLPSGVRHVRSARWVSTDVTRSLAESILADMPPLTMIYHVPENESAERLLSLAEGDQSPPINAGSARGSVDDESSLPFANLQRNLSYARNLAAAGHHLSELQVTSFEVTDVYRAAWVQGVAALDYWVRQEVRSRMLRLAQIPSGEKPRGYLDFAIPLADVEGLLQSRISLADVVDEQLSRTTGHIAYQQPNRIHEALSLISDVKGLWARVATVLSEQAREGEPITGRDVQRQLSEIVRRRNKIAHEYDEDPQDPPTKRFMDSAAVTQTIDWIEQLAAAILVALDDK